MAQLVAERRPLGTSGIMVSPIAMGCWPISGMTTLGVTEAEALATLEQAVEWCQLLRHRVRLRTGGGK